LPAVSQPPLISSAHAERLSANQIIASGRTTPAKLRIVQPAPNTDP
jgi:hypothetical protein